MLPNARGVMITVDFLPLCGSGMTFTLRALFEVSDTAYPLLTAQLSPITERFTALFEAYGMDLVSEDLRGISTSFTHISYSSVLDDVTALNRISICSKTLC